MSLHLVTYCSHQPFLHLFHKTDLKLDIILLKQTNRFLQNWDERVRPLPAHWQLIDYEEAKRRASAGRYQVAMAHNISDYMDLLKLGLPLVLVMHTSLSSRYVEERAKVDKAAYRIQFAELVRRTGGHFVFVTPTKKEDWQLPGEVIVAGIDPDEYPNYHGERASLLRVTNNLQQRASILGYDLHKRISSGFAIEVVGSNPGLVGARPAGSWQELKEYYQSRRALLHTAIPVMEDGYNLAVIEAMASGMPVIATTNPTSPLSDGVNGYISGDVARLRSDVARLLEDRQLATRLGAAARETVRQAFHYRRFADQWQALLQGLL